jgi:hypothetical protein
MTRWRVHIGAPKTGTTHLQALLEHHRSRLLENDIDAFESAKLRRLLRERPSRGGTLMRIKKAIGLAPSLAQELSSLRSGKGTTVFSEEGLTGTADQLIDTVFFRNLGRSRVIDALPDREGLVLFLSIRSHESILASAFAESLKARPDTRARFETLRGALVQAPPRWSQLVETLTTLYPGTDLVVWTFEDYVRQPRFAFEALVGSTFAQFEDIPPPPNTQSPSRRALELAEELDPTLPWRERRRSVVQLYLQHPKQKGEDIGLFSAAEKAILEDAYRRDLEAFPKIPGVSFLRPPALV